tara:strand:+ start:526 stop:1776 length:1251 start_codon:yes stop_codon:yes gene_type:complete
MKLFYRIVSELFLLISPLIILYRIIKGKENICRFSERYAIRSKNRTKGKLIWFHCSSVGELLSIIPLIEKLESNTKINQILITTTTLSSSKIFEKLNLKKSVHQFFPIDNQLIINKFINYWKPSVFFLCESEIWPNLINSINKKKIKLILINARMTLKSYKKWKKIKSFSKEVFKKFDLCFAQNTETYKRLSSLGARKINNIGNLKFTTSKKVKSEVLEKKILNFFKIKKILITAASTHFDEENFIIQNHLYFKMKKKMKNIVSIIVPRHIDRTGQIKKDIEEHSLKTHLHSYQKKINKDIDVYIVDTYGELNKFYKVSNLVFMGGSLIKHGGQNPLEPAKLGCKIIHGPNISNFKEVYEKLRKMNVANMFNSYNKGTKIINKTFNKKQLVIKNKKLIKYGDKILNLTYLKIIKFI